MAAEYTLVIEGNDLSNEIFTHVLQETGLKCDELIKRGRGIEIKQFYETHGLMMHLFESGDPPYNALDFEFFNREFTYGQCLRFRYCDNFDNPEIQWRTMISIVFAYEFDTLYCFFAKTHELFINKKSGIWNNQYFIEKAVDWKCFDIENSITAKILQ